MVMKAPALSLSHERPVPIRVGDGQMLMDPEAKAIVNARSTLEDRLGSGGPGCVVPLLLENVELSASCLAALLGPILLKLVGGAYPGRYVVGVDPDLRNRWDADAGLAKESRRTRRKLVCVWENGAEPELLGEVDDQVRSTYRFVLVQGESGATARDLADQESSLSIQAASNRLAKAQKLGVIHRATRRPVAGSGGSENVYVAVH